MTYAFKTEPWAHQREALRRAWKRRGFAYLMEMGTGKSKVAVDEASLYHEEGLARGWVVIAPKGVYENWIRKEIPEHMPDRVREKAMIVLWRGDGTKTRKQELDQLIRYRRGLAVLVMNVEALSSSSGAAARYLTKFLAAHPSIVHLDESTTIKTPGAVRTKTLVKIGGLARWRRIMTGSPVTRGPLDLYSQFDFLDEGILGFRSFYAFRARFSVMETKNFGGRRFQIPVAPRNLDDLAERMRSHSYRVTKDECLDLPPKIFERRDVELTPEQATMYASLRENALATLSGGELMTATHVLTQMLRLQQLICGHVVSDDGVEQDVPSNRVNAVLDVAAETDGKIVIWSRFRRDVAKIGAALRAEHGANTVAEFHGGNVDTRQTDVGRFLTDPECRFMISNQQSGGYGNTWVVASTMIYFSNDFSLERRIQSEDRAHRAGQTRSVTYVDLVTPGTVDEKIVKTLRARMDVASAVTGDAAREWIV